MELGKERSPVSPVTPVTRLEARRAADSMARVTSTYPHRQSDARLRATSALTSRFVEGDLDGALAVLDEMIATYPERRHNQAYLRTMLLSLRGRTDEAVAEILSSVGAGGWWSPERLADPDLDALAVEPGYLDAV